MTFWLIVLCIGLAVGVVAFYPLLSNKQQFHFNQRDELNKIFYFSRLQEIKSENEVGIIDDLPQFQFELQQRLLNDIPEKTAQLAVFPALNKVWFITLLCLLIGGSGAIYLNVGYWFTENMLEQNHQKLPYFYERLKLEQSKPFSEQELNQFLLALRVELQQKTHDAPSWYMLGQVAMAMDNGKLALDSFLKALKLQPENISYKLSYAQMLMLSSDENDKAQGEWLLKEIIRIDHTNIEALSLLAFRAFEQEDYKMAVLTWEMMLHLLPKSDPRIETVERSIQAARSMMKKE